MKDYTKPEVEVIAFETEAIADELIEGQTLGTQSGGYTGGL